MDFGKVSLAIAMQNTLDILNVNKLYTPRHSRVRAELKAGKFIKGAILGDSNGAGTGASAYTNNWIWSLVKKIRDFANAGTSNDFDIKTYAVGSQNIRQAVPFVAYTRNGRRSDKLKIIEKYPYLIIMTGLNESGGNPVPLDEFEWLYRLTVRTAVNRGIDVFCCTETCGVNMSDGSLKTAAEAAYAPYRDVIINVAAQEGASMVDINLRFRQLREQREDLRQYSADGTHLNDRGQAIVADLIFQCITSPSIGGARQINPNEQEKYKFVPSVLLNYDNNSKASYVTDLTLSNGGLRALNDKTDMIKIEDGGHVDFNIPSFSFYAILVTVVMKASTGKLSIQSRIGVSLTGASNITIPNQLNNNSETTLIYYAGAQAADIRNGIRLLATGGDVYVSGITLIAPTLIAEHTPRPVPTKTTGTWGGHSFNPTYTDVYSSNGVGDKLTFRWYGTAIEFDAIVSPTSGQANIATDGDAVMRDLYSTGVTEATISNHKTYPLGWHTTTIEVAGKNASATDNYIGITGVRVYSPKNQDDTIIARANAGINVYTNIIEAMTVSGVLDYTLENNVVAVETDAMLEVKAK